MQEKKYTFVADFAIRNRLAYLSHQETLTLFQRCLLRSGLPVAFSEGFNPRPRVSIPLARSVGTQSVAERVCAILTSDVETEPLSRLQDHLPEGCDLLAVRCIEGKCTFHPCIVHYVFHLEGSLSKENLQHLICCQAELTAGGDIQIQRYRAKKRIYEPIDISSFVEKIDFSGNMIEIVCRISPEGTVRIDELMQWLAVEPEQLSEPIKRTEIQWKQN